MADRWHFNPDTGKTGRCQATVGNCRFGSDDDSHFDTQEDAQRAYENTQKTQLFAVSRPKPTSLSDMAVEQEKILSNAIANQEAISGINLKARKVYVEEIIERLTKSGRTTQDHFSRKSHSGQRVYADKRAEMHEEIVSEIIDKAIAKGVKRNGEAIFSGGLGGAGKTTVLNGYVGVDNDSYIVVNPDDIKEIMAEKKMIPGVKGLTPMEASPLAHEEASHISKILLNRVAKEKFNIIIDITMSDVDKVKARADLLRENGYSSVNAVFVDIKPETSLQRASFRYAHGMSQYTELGKGNGGRFLPSHIVEGNKTDDPMFNSQNAKNLVALNRMRVFSEEPLVFNNDGDAPVPVSYDEFSGDFSEFLE